MKKFSNLIMIDVKKEFIIRDNVNGIKILYKLVVELKVNVNEELRYLCDKYNYMSNIDMFKVSKYFKNLLYY